MKRFAQLLLLLLVCGCTKTVTKAELETKSRQGEHFTFPDQTYYTGSDGRFDYFVIRTWGNGPKNWYRVFRTENAVTNRFSVTKDETRWVGYGITGIVNANFIQIGSNAVQSAVPK